MLASPGLLLSGLLADAFSKLVYSIRLETILWLFGLRADFEEGDWLLVLVGVPIPRTIGLLLDLVFTPMSITLQRIQDCMSKVLYMTSGR